MPVPVPPELVEEATRRSGLVWLQSAAGTRAVWHVWHEGAALVVHGGLEQPLPGVAPGDRVLVVVRSRERQDGRVVQWWADVERVEPGSAAWEEAVPPLAARRLNAPDGDRTAERWARHSTVLRLVPDGTGEPVPGDPGQ